MLQIAFPTDYLYGWDDEMQRHYRCKGASAAREYADVPEVGDDLHDEDSITARWPDGHEFVVWNHSS